MRTITAILFVVCVVSSEAAVVRIDNVQSAQPSITMSVALHAGITLLKSDSATLTFRIDNDNVAPSGLGNFFIQPGYIPTTVDPNAVRWTCYRTSTGFCPNPWEGNFYALLPSGQIAFMDPNQDYGRFWKIQNPQNLDISMKNNFERGTFVLSGSGLVGLTTAMVSNSTTNTYDATIATYWYTEGSSGTLFATIPPAPCDATIAADLELDVANHHITITPKATYVVAGVMRESLFDLSLWFVSPYDKFLHRIAGDNHRLRYDMHSLSLNSAIAEMVIADNETNPRWVSLMLSVDEISSAGKLLKDLFTDIPPGTGDILINECIGEWLCGWGDTCPSDFLPAITWSPSPTASSTSRTTQSQRSHVRARYHLPLRLDDSVRIENLEEIELIVHDDGQGGKSVLIYDPRGRKITSALMSVGRTDVPKPPAKVPAQHDSGLLLLVASVCAMTVGRRVKLRR